MKNNTTKADTANIPNIENNKKTLIALLISIFISGLLVLITVINIANDPQSIKDGKVQERLIEQLGDLQEKTNKLVDELETETEIKPEQNP